MILDLKGNEIVRAQRFEVEEDLIGIYGYNNSGKTTVLKEFDRIIDKNNRKNIIENGIFTKSLFIPTNRIITRQAYTNNKNIKDLEGLLSYKKDCYNEFDLHLRTIRDLLLCNEFIRRFIIEALEDMFGHYEFDFNKRQSDGVENIINIYCNIIWILTWNENVESFNYTMLKECLGETAAVIMIDEIEIFLHVYVQSKMLQKLKQDFAKCSIIFTTHSPLLLSRCKNIKKFHLEDGILNEITEDLYYKCLDNIYETYFDVDEFPKEAKNIINVLGKYIMGAHYDKSEIQSFIKILNTQYINISKKYVGLITKAENKLEV